MFGPGESQIIDRFGSIEDWCGALAAETTIFCSSDFLDERVFQVSTSMQVLHI